MCTIVLGEISKVHIRKSDVFINAKKSRWSLVHGLVMSHHQVMRRLSRFVVVTLKKVGDPMESYLYFWDL